MAKVKRRDDVSCRSCEDRPADAVVCLWCGRGMTAADYEIDKIKECLDDFARAHRDNDRKTATALWIKIQDLMENINLE